MPQTRRKIWGLVMALAVAAEVFSGGQVSAANVTVAGRVYNKATGAGYANVAIYLCGANGYAYSGDDGSWKANLASGAGYCARVVGGAPAGLSASAVNNNPEVGGVDTYEYQTAGKNCYKSKDASCSVEARKWDRKDDNGVDFAFGAAATPTPAAAPAPAGSGAPPAAGRKATSVDGVASADVSAAPESATCTVTNGPKVQNVDWGPYGLECKDANGSVLTSQGTVRWTFSLGDKVKQFKALSALTIDNSSKIRAVNGAIYDPKGKTLAFDAPAGQKVAARGTNLQPPVYYLAVAGAALLVAVIVGIWWWRGRRARNYRDYLKSQPPPQSR